MASLPPVLFITMGSKDKVTESRFPGGAAAALCAAAVFFLHGCFADPAQTSYEKAEASLGEGRYKEALVQYSAVARKFGSSPYGAKSLLRVAFIYGSHFDDYERALKTFSEIVYLYPGSREAAEARREKARIYSLRGEHAKAVEEYQALVEQAEGPTEKVRFQIAMEYVKMNDLKQARVEFADLLKRSVSDELVKQIKFQLANTYYIEGNRTEALKMFEEIVSEYPESPISYEARFTIARVYDEQGRLPEALEMLKGLEGKYPNAEALKTAVQWTEKRLNTGPEHRR